MALANLFQPLCSCSCRCSSWTVWSPSLNLNLNLNLSLTLALTPTTTPKHYHNHSPNHYLSLSLPLSGVSKLKCPSWLKIRSKSFCKQTGLQRQDEIEFSIFTSSPQSSKRHLALKATAVLMSCEEFCWAWGRYSRLAAVQNICGLTHFGLT